MPGRSVKHWYRMERKEVKLTVGTHKLPLMYENCTIPKSFISNQVHKERLEYCRKCGKRKWKLENFTRSFLRYLSFTGLFHLSWYIWSRVHGPFLAYLSRIGRIGDPSCATEHFGDEEYYLAVISKHQVDFVRPSLQNSDQWLKKMVKNKFTINKYVGMVNRLAIDFG